MKKWVGYLFLAILIVVALFFVVSLIMASFHNQGIVAEWQSWFDGIKSSKETVETAARIFIR